MDASILIAAVASFLLIYFLKVFNSGHQLPPGPIGLPFVGYLAFLSRKLHTDLDKLAKKYGSVFGFKMGSVYVVVLNDFDSTKEAFSQDAFMGRPKNLPFSLNKETYETGAMFGVPWKEQRKFSLHSLRDLGFGKTKMEEHVQEEINCFLRHLEASDGKPFVVVDLLISSMSNNIGSLMFGKRFEYDDPNMKMIIKALKDGSVAAGDTGWHLFFPTIKNICQFLGIGDVDKLARIQRGFRSYIKKEIEEHEKTLDPKEIRDFIDRYLLEIDRRNDPAFCKPVLQDLVVSFYGGGTENVRHIVEWLLLTAAAYQDAQRRVQNEIDSVFGQSRSPVYSDHKCMPYTEAFISELLRWKTIIPINPPRCTLQDTTLSGYFIPKDTCVLANLWAIFHDPKYWGEDVEEFRPERFLTEDGKAVKQWEHFIPFSIGKRACPGEPFAKLEVFLYFVSILQRFDVRFPDGKEGDLEGQVSFVIIPKPQELLFIQRH